MMHRGLPHLPYTIFHPLPSSPASGCRTNHSPMVILVPSLTMMMIPFPVLTMCYHRNSILHMYPCPHTDINHLREEAFDSQAPILTSWAQGAVLPDDTKHVWRGLLPVELALCAFWELFLAQSNSVIGGRATGSPKGHYRLSAFFINRDPVYAAVDEGTILLLCLPLKLVSVLRCRPTIINLTYI